RDEGLQALLEVGCPLCLELLQIVEYLEYSVLTASGRHDGADALPRRHHGDPIEVCQPHISERRTQAPRLIDLARGLGRPRTPRNTPRPKRHRGGAIHDEIDAQIFFLFIEPYEQAPEALVDVPIHEAKVVARRVRAVVGELDTAALLLRAPLGAHP